MIDDYVYEPLWFTLVMSLCLPHIWTCIKGPESAHNVYGISLIPTFIKIRNEIKKRKFDVIFWQCENKKYEDHI